MIQSQQYQPDIEQLEKRKLNINIIKELNYLIIYMTEDNIFSDEYLPYHYSSQYEDQICLQHIADLSRYFYQSTNTHPQESILECVDLQKKQSVQIISRDQNILIQKDQKLLKSYQNPEEETMVFEPIVFEQKRRYYEEEMEEQYSQIEEENVPNRERFDTQKIKKCSDQIQAITFNSVDYIIKHCFKRMLSPLYQEQIKDLCEQFKCTYSFFRNFWSKKLQKKRSSIHIGLNKFKEMIGQVQRSEIRICREFFTLYLWRDYAQYVTNGNMLNKQQYMRCASKLMYISNPKNKEGVSMIECSQTMSR